MRKSFLILAVAAVLLPGCVFAVGNGPDEGSRMKKLEQRVNALEARVDKCEACCAKPGS